MRAGVTRASLARHDAVIAKANMQGRMYLHGNAARAHRAVGGLQLEILDRHAGRETLDRERRTCRRSHACPCARAGRPSGAIEAAEDRKAIEGCVDGDGIGEASAVVTDENAHRLDFGGLKTAVDRSIGRDARSGTRRVASRRRDENAVALADEARVVGR